jgi:hypothetical protein
MYVLLYMLLQFGSVTYTILIQMCNVQYKYNLWQRMYKKDEVELHPARILIATV